MYKKKDKGPELSTLQVVLALAEISIMMSNSEIVESVLAPFLEPGDSDAPGV